eukprot:3399380-Pyramimonas_sp.AAC.1
MGLPDGGEPRREGSGAVSCSSEALPWLKSLARQGRSDFGRPSKNSARWVAEQRAMAYLRHFRASSLQVAETVELDEMARKNGLNW